MPEVEVSPRIFMEMPRNRVMVAKVTIMGASSGNWVRITPFIAPQASPTARAAKIPNAAEPVAL